MLSKLPENLAVMTSIVILIVLFFLESLSTVVHDFLSGTLGYLIKAVLVSGIIIPKITPQIQKLAPSYFKRQSINKLYESIICDVKSNKQLDKAKYRDAVTKIYCNVEINSQYIDNIDEIESALLLFVLQWHNRELKCGQDIDNKHILQLAEKASKLKDYRICLLTLSLVSLTDDAFRLAEKIESKTSNFIGPRTDVQVSDDAFFTRLSNAISEEVYIFTTTSQISNQSFKYLEGFSRNIKMLNLFMVNPQIKSHPALSKLTTEYDVPQFAFPKTQFMDNENLDLLRRVLRILIGIRNTEAFSTRTNMPITMHLFNESYPGIKLRLLRDRSYAQIFPGCLSYANNLYRFGVEITDKEMIDELLTLVKSYSNKGLVTITDLKPDTIKSLESQALKEIYYHLLENSVDVQAIGAKEPLFYIKLKDENAKRYLTNIIKLDKFVKNAVDTYDFWKAVGNDEENISIVTDELDETNNFAIKKLPDGNKAHVSVGVIFMRDNKLLLIKKNKAPYEGKYSIVGGHLCHNETPVEAIIREIKEELGIDVYKINLLKKFYNIKGDLCRYNFTNHIWFVFESTELLDDLDIQASKDEIEDYEWVKIEDLKYVSEYTFASKEILANLGFI